MMKIIYFILIQAIFLNCGAIAQESHFVKVETNKVLCLLSFLEAAAKDRSAPPSLIKIIHKNLAADKEFQEIVHDYKAIKTAYHLKREEYPASRDTYIGSKDFLWIASANAENIDDFNERIIGFLPHSSQQQLIDCMRKVEPYYDQLIWNKETENMRLMEKELSAYRNQIEELFLKISKFYGTEWDSDMPFKIMLYPIPAKQGGTTAIPKGNNLICSYLSHNKQEYKHILGIAIHEMCHILYDAQSIDTQKNLESWFLDNPSEYNSVAYSYINEGLATALGNGWAFKELHQKTDTTDWYNDSYINDFAHAIFQNVDTYMQEDKTIDQAFVENAVSSFELSFPDAIRDINILLTSVQIFTDFNNENDGNAFLELLFKYFDGVRSVNFSTPIMDPSNTEKLITEGTKLIVINNSHSNNLNFLSTHVSLANKNLDPHKDWIYSFKENSSTIIILNIQEATHLGKALSYLVNNPKISYENVLHFLK